MSIVHYSKTIFSLCKHKTFTDLASRVFISGVFEGYFFFITQPLLQKEDAF